MKCLLKYQWVKLSRTHLPAGKGIMGYWSRLASKAAFRKGQASYCGYFNDVNAGTWSGGVTGLKSILGVKSRQGALDIMNTLQCLGFIEYDLDPQTKKLTYKILDYVLKCTGEPCLGTGAVYAVDDYGFICLPRGITQRLAEDGYTFEEADAWLDLWCHSVWQDPRNIFSGMAPVVQYGQHGAVLTLDSLGHRWNWEKTKVWRFLQKNKDSFALHKLPGSYGCLIFNMLYPTGETNVEVEHTEVIRILDEIRIAGQNTHKGGTDNERINKHIAWFSENTINRGISRENPERMSIADEILISTPNMYAGAEERETECKYPCNINFDNTGNRENISIPANMLIYERNTYLNIDHSGLIVEYGAASHFCMQEHQRTVRVCERMSIPNEILIYGYNTYINDS